ncbi:hypothetical protein TD95_001790 [Thielaviopsis punctulata]|uniref:Pre-mRNA polyadenylation factor Fip1 domain-containing protein n=1 Tax=Thielaviopsis punctulata TaxID=72032 RepID=A0A0F4ZLR5_9PEZI|nr:hypothetical protein TD95_001790 [Thielaviopsis punctulata]
MSAPAMDVDDDDLYSDEAEQVGSPPKTVTNSAEEAPATALNPSEKANTSEGDAPDGDDDEEEEEEDDSDIDIITQRPDGSKPEPPQQSRQSDIQNVSQRSITDAPGAKNSPNSPHSEHESTPNTNANPPSRLPGLGHAPSGPDQASGSGATSHVAPLPVPKADQAAQAASTSKLNINGNPVYPPAGKPIMSVVIDTDLPDNEKPWRQPGTDLSDYFNYGFDEFTWALYAAKQESLRNEFSADALMANQKKMMEEFNNMMMGGMGGGMPGGMPGMPGMPGMSGMDADMMPPEMQQMMQQMMGGGGPGGPQGGMDMSQMDQSMFGGNNDGPGNGGQGGQDSFQQQFGNQGGDFGGYNNQGRGGFNNRGRGGRRHW